MADLDVAVRLKFLTDGEGRLKAAAKDLAAFGKSVNQLSGRATGRFGSDLNKAWHASAKLGGSLDKSARAAGKTANAMRAIGSGATGIDRARAFIDRLTKSTNALASAEKKVRGRAIGAGAGTALAAGAVGAAAAKNHKAAFRDGLSEAASRITPEGYLIGAGTAVAAGAAVGGTVASVGAAMAYGTKQAIDFEKAMADVKKKVTLDKGASWGDVEQAINKVSREMGMARTDTAALTAMAGQAGIAYKDLTAFMRLAAKTATSWDIAPKEASERLAKIKAQTQWTIPQLAELADKVNALGDSSASAERDIAEMFQRAAGSAKAANVPLDTSLAVTTALNSIGMQEEVAARFWNAFSSKMRTAASGGRGAKNAAEGYKMLGLTLKQVEQGMKTDATKTILDVLGRLEKSSEKASAAVKIFGQEWWDEAARSGQALPEIRKNLEMLASGSWNGSLDQNLKINLETTSNHLERFKALTSEIGDNMMRWALPPINAQLDRLIKSYETAKKTGFLPGADGEPIDRHKDKTPVPFSDANRRLFLSGAPQGESVDAYAKRLRLNQSAAPMFAQIEGAKPHVDMSQIDAAKADAVAKGAEMEKALSFTAKPTVDISAASAALDALVAKATAAKAAIGSMAISGGGINVHPSLTGRKGGVGSTGGGGSAPATPGKQARLGRGHVTQIAAVHIHGHRNLASIEREINRRVRSARDNALHDVG